MYARYVRSIALTSNWGCRDGPDRTGPDRCARTGLKQHRYIRTAVEEGLAECFKPPPCLPVVDIVEDKEDVIFTCVDWKAPSKSADWIFHEAGRRRSTSLVVRESPSSWGSTTISFDSGGGGVGRSLQSISLAPARRHHTSTGWRTEARSDERTYYTVDCERTDLGLELRRLAGHRYGEGAFDVACKRSTKWCRRRARDWHSGAGRAASDDTRGSQSPCR